MSKGLNTVFRTDLFIDRYALVTGGGTGIGLRIARELAALGAFVFIAARKVERLKSAEAEITSTGGRCQAVELNVRSTESIDRCLDTILERSGGALDMLVNNAGGQFPSPAENISERGWKAVVDLNLTGLFLVTQRCYIRAFSTPLQRERGGATVVNIVANVRSGFPLMSHTGAARAAVINLTKSLAIEWASSGVRINCVAPGIIASSGLETYPEEFKHRIRTESKTYAYSYRLGTEAECSAATVFLLANSASFITGQTLYVDGGASLYHPLLPPSEHSASVPFDDASSAPLLSRL